MPEFPRYESKGKLTTQQPSFLAAESTEGKITEKVGEVFDTAHKQVGKFTDALNTIQKTTASANFKTGVLEIQQAFQNIPNPTIKDYNDTKAKIDKLKSDSLKGITFDSTKKEAAIGLDYESKVAGIQLDNHYKKKVVEAGQTALLTIVDSEVRNPTEYSLEYLNDLINHHVDKGILDTKDAYTIYKKANDDLGVNQISKDLYQAKTPEEVDAVTQKITSGGYEQGGVTIEPDKKKALLDIADRAKTNTEKKLQAEDADALVKNRMETIVGLASGQLQFENLTMAEIAEYDPQLAGTLTKVKDFMVNYNPKLLPKEQPLASAGLMTPQQIMNARSYARTITDTFLQNDNEKLSAFVLRELESKGDGLTPSVKLAAFANLAYLKSKANNQQNVEDTKAAGRFSAIKSGVKFLQSSNPYIAPVAIGEFIVRNFLSGASGQDQVIEEAKSVLKDKILDRYKSIAKLPSLPNKVIDGESSAENIYAGSNELEGEAYSGSYSDQDRSD